MNKPPLLPVALGLGGLALVGTLVLMKSSSTPPPAIVETAQAAPAPAPKITSIIARQFIPPRTVITASMLVEQETDAPTPGALTDRSAIIGKLAATPIFAGASIKPSNVTEPLQRVVPANFEIPTGMRAVSIYVDPKSTSAGLVDIGDRVDVIASHKAKYEKQDTDYWSTAYTGLSEYTIGRTVAQDLLVLAVDRSIDAPPPTPTPEPQPQGQPGQPGQPSDPNAPPPANPVPTPVPQPGVAAEKTRVIVAAPPVVAARLAAASDQATLHVVIRNPNERDQRVIGEQKEYPTRIYTVPKKEKEAPINNMANALQSTQPVMPAPIPPQSVQVEEPAKSPEPAPVKAPAPEKTEKEIVVIRGTEKTRVLVPGK